MPEDIDRLRAEVKRLRRAVTRKVSRLKQAHDVFLSGTQFDPRRAPRSEARYSASQLRSYIHDLAGFVDRGNQFVGDAQRRPIPRSDWQRYKNLENQYNARVNEYFDRVKGVRLPSGETVAERMARVTPDHRQMGNPAVHAPFDPVERQPGNVASKAALDKLIDAMKKRLQPDYFEKKNREGMEQFEKMMDILNDSELKEAVKGLNDEQFALLWNYTGFPTAISIQYEFALKALSAEQQSFERDVSSVALRRAHELVNDAKNFPVGR